MTERSLAKDLHRLMRRVGRLTDGQASIDNVNWEDGELDTFGVTIRPNASFYKGGRFKFTVYIPESFIGNNSLPRVWCDTTIYHPNIDTSRKRSSKYDTNICLDLFSSDAWNSAHGLEGVILGILFLMHNPNLDDALVWGLPSGDVDGVNQFAEEVKEYMATGQIDDVLYEIDFRVINGEFKEFPEVESKIESNVDSITNSNETAIEFPDLIEDDVEEEDIRPVRFTKLEMDDDYDTDEDDEGLGGYFVITFEGDNESQHVDNDVGSANDNTTSFEREDNSMHDIHSVANDKLDTTMTDYNTTPDDSRTNESAESEDHCIHIINYNKDSTRNEENVICDSTNIETVSAGIKDNDIHESVNDKNTVNNESNGTADLNRNYNDLEKPEHTEQSKDLNDENHEKKLGPTLFGSLNPNHADIDSTEKNKAVISIGKQPLFGNFTIEEQCILFGIVFNLVGLVLKKIRKS